MKYLHSGYILFCQKADYSDEGRVNAEGIFDLFATKELPLAVDCAFVISFGTPYERRQYKGELTVESPDAKAVFTQDFSANDPDDLHKGHYICRPHFNLDKQGLWTAKVILKNHKDEAVWECERKFWTMIEGDAPPDP